MVEDPKIERKVVTIFDKSESKIEEGSWGGFSKERASKGRNCRNWVDGSKERLSEFNSSSVLIYFQVPLLVKNEGGDFVGFRGNHSATLSRNALKADLLVPILLGFK
ncbi:hypothetical protein NE237_000485 [Protea cynaroides]|uniref:Uncharacterized protein n=1 Tax=Protea cynaroides TaxID=273540 RepID=A0A9Q0KRN1_9MAGN|nr:hypothetical protein NE237_000485 [Protea cynaroides]